MDNYVALNNLTKVYTDRSRKKVTAVDNVTVGIEKGTFVTLLGPSGCGKTTILRMVAGFEETTKGTIYIDNQDMTFVPPNKRKAAMVFQQYALFPHMDVFHNVSFGLEMQSMPKQQIKDEVIAVLEKTGLHNLLDRFPGQLSGGQQQRVALARALVTKPRVLLCDEPLSNLDASLRIQMRTEIRAIQQEYKITTLYVTHDQEEAMAVSDRIILLRDGVIEQDGKPCELYDAPANDFVRSFMQ
jgi:iron(III) transport system ATP-binding protein